MNGWEKWVLIGVQQEPEVGGIDGQQVINVAPCQQKGIEDASGGVPQSCIL